MEPTDMKVNTLANRPLLVTLRADMDAALAAVAKKYGIAIRVGNASYTSAAATFKVELAVVGEGQEGEDPAVLRAAASWKSAAMLYEYQGLNPDWLGKSFESMGVTYTIIGLDAKKRSRPVLCRKSDAPSKIYLLPIEKVVYNMTMKTKRAA
jgi:hypothetical protein